MNIFIMLETTATTVIFLSFSDNCDYIIILPYTQLIQNVCHVVLTLLTTQLHIITIHCRVEIQVVILAIGRLAKLPRLTTDTHIHDSCTVISIPHNTYTAKTKQLL